MNDERLESVLRLHKKTLHNIHRHEALQMGISYMKSFEVLEVILLDLSDLVVLQVQQGGVVWDVPRNGCQT